jgi:hypothetical protein
MRRALVALAIAAGCSTPLPPAAKPAPVAVRAPVTQLDLARDYELGSGVARDYAAAATIYDHECAAGSGDLVACAHLLESALEDRGPAFGADPAAAMIGTMCKRGEPSACIVLAMTSQGEPPPNVLATLKTALAEPCDAKHLARCELPRDPFRFFNQSGSVEHEDNDYDDSGCQLGVLAACERLQFASGPAHDHAFGVLGKACAHGDARACDTIDKPIDAAVLCAAHDYAACARQGCAGDEPAALAAAEHHIAPRCENQRATDGVVKVTTGIAPSAKQPFDSIEFHRLGTSDAFEVFNAGTKGVTLFIGSIYAYDAAGNQLTDAHYEMRYLHMAPGDGTTLDARVHELAATTLEPCISYITFDDGTGFQGRCPRQKAKGARWGDGRATVVVTAGLGDIPLAGPWGGASTLLAEPFEATHPGIYVSTENSSGAVYLAPSYYPAEWRAQRVKQDGPVLELPAVLEPTEIAYHLAGIDALKLSAATVAKIFSKQITLWNDPAIAHDNPGVKLPPTAITVLQGYSNVDERRVTAWLARNAKSSWKLGEKSAGEDFFPGVQRMSLDEAAHKGAETDGVIAYLGPGMAGKYGLGVAVLPSPIATMRSLFIAEKATPEERVYTTWLLTDGLANFEKLGYLRPPAAVTQAALAKIPR